MRQDKTGGQFPNWQDRDKTTFLWSHCSEKSGKNPGNKMFPNATGNFQDCFGKKPAPGKWHSGTQTSTEQQQKLSFAQLCANKNAQE